MRAHTDISSIHESQQDIQYLTRYPRQWNYIHPWQDLSEVRTTCGKEQLVRSYGAPVTADENHILQVWVIEDLMEPSHELEGISGTTKTCHLLLKDKPRQCHTLFGRVPGHRNRHREAWLHGSEVEICSGRSLLSDPVVHNDIVGASIVVFILDNDLRYSLFKVIINLKVYFFVISINSRLSFGLSYWSRL